MQRNKYLDDLGISINHYGTNIISDDDGRQEFWKSEREQYGFDERECWALDRTFCEWLYSHLMKYKEDASGLINLEYHKFIYNGCEYTQLEMIDMIIENLRYVLTNSDWDNKSPEKFKEATKMWAEVGIACWW